MQLLATCCHGRSPTMMLRRMDGRTTSTAHANAVEAARRPAPLNPHSDRLFPSDPAQRAIARRLHESMWVLPLIIIRYRSGIAAEDRPALSNTRVPR
ncbi:hypothetical protein [Saccharopolyspora sp. NPDC002686]|uniref:hypothetical protein n=1 Tax=Saccharopolyspora sp. NPDC002686 TaxID=3154541 RepID=UPI003320AB55